MTFNQAEVVNVVTFTGSASNDNTNTVYTVPAGKYAIINIHGLSVSGSDGGSGSVSIGLNNYLSGINGNKIEKDLLVGTDFILNAGQTVTATSVEGIGESGNGSVSGVALEFNLP